MLIHYILIIFNSESLSNSVFPNTKKMPSINYPYIMPSLTKSLNILSPAILYPLIYPSSSL